MWAEACSTASCRSLICAVIPFFILKLKPVPEPKPIILFFLLLSGLALLAPAQSRGQCTVDFSVDQSRTCIYLPVTFKSHGVAPGSTLFWIVEEDTISGTQNYARFFSQPGQYDIGLMAVSGTDTCSILRPDFITVGTPPAKPVIQLPQMLHCNLNEPLVLGSNSEEMLSRNWNIGSTYLPDTTDSLLFTFPRSGYYTVSLNVVDSNHCQAFNSIDSVRVLSPPRFDIDLTDTLVCVPKAVSFSYVPDSTYRHTITDWNWSFPGGSPASSTQRVPPAVTYATAGAYDVTLTVTNNLGCSYTLTKEDLVTAGQVKSLSFSASTHYACDRQEVIFENTTAGLLIDSLSWDFSGGDVQPASIPDSQVVEWARNGMYTVVMSYNDRGCISEAVDSVEVAAIGVNFQADHTCRCKWPDTIQFSENVSYRGTGTLSYSWTFYDTDGSTVLSTSSSPSPDVIYQNTGRYDFELTATDGKGCSETRRFNNRIRLEELDASFSASPRVACPGAPINFRVGGSTCSDQLTRIEWTFYDTDSTTILGTADSSARVDFTFPNSGQYHARLIVENSDGCVDTIIRYNYVTVEPLDLAVAVPDSVVCLGNSTTLQEVNPANHTLDFWWIVTSAATGDTVYSDEASKPDVVLPDTGWYHVEMAGVSAGVCADTVFRQQAIYVYEIEADFAPIAAEGCLPFSTTLQSNVQMAEGVAQYLWQAESDSGISFSDSTAANPVVTVSEKGCYSIRLIVSNAAGCADTILKDSVICVGVIADFHLDSLACIGEQLQVLDSSSIHPSTYEWLSSSPFISFSPSATVAEPVVSAAVEDTAVISLVVSNAAGCRDTLSQEVIFEDFQVEFSSPDTGGLCTPAFVTFSVNGSQADSFYWEFGDGQSLVTTQRNLGHVYDLQKLDSLYSFFNVTLIAYRGSGCTDTVVKDSFIYVIGPYFDFTYVSPVGCEPLLVQFVDSSKNVVDYIFDYGDGTSVQQNSMQDHWYQVQGTQAKAIYYPSIIATDGKGCVTSYTPADSIVVYSKPVLQFAPAEDTGCAPFTVAFKNTTLFADRYYWDFESDGVVDDTTETPVHVFGAGTYSVTLMAENDYGCRDTLHFDSLITVFPAPQAAFTVTDTVGCFGTLLQFTNLSTSTQGIIDSTLWDFGDTASASDTSSLFSPGFTYGSPGSFIPHLVVVDTNGCRDTSILNRLVVVDTVPLPARGLKYVTVGWSPATGDTGEVAYWYPDSVPLFDEYRLFRKNVLEAQIQNPQQERHTHPMNGGFTGPACYELEQADACGNVSGRRRHCTMYLTVQQAGQRQLQLNWSPYVGWGGVKQYHVLRQDTAGWDTVATLSGTTTNWLDANLCNFTYCYAILAVHPQDSFVSRSNTSCKKAPYDPAVASLKLLNTTVWQDSLVFTYWEPDTTRNFSHYLVDRLVPGEGLQTGYAQSTRPELLDSLVDVHASWYRYFVRSVDACGNVGAPSNPGTSIFLQLDPQEAGFALSWNPYRQFPQGVSHYLIQRKTDQDTAFMTIAQVQATDSAFLDEEVNQWVNEHCYRVVAVEQESSTASYSNIACGALPSQLFIPTAFSPNADGHNDTFYVYGIFLRENGEVRFKEYELQIFNRWGQLIFQTDDIRQGWSGTHNGQPVPEEVYVWKVNAIGLDDEIYRVGGQVMVVR